MTKLLALDTATEALSVALNVNGEIFHRSTLAGRKHTQLLLPTIQSLLAEAGLTVADLDGIAVGVGPGSFTGIRIALATAQGLALPHDLPMLPVSNLAVLALGAAQLANETHVFAASDARMGELYMGAYDCTDLAEPVLIGVERVCSPTQIDWPKGDEWVCAGSGWVAYPDAQAQIAPRALIAEDLLPDAINMLAYAERMLSQGKGVSSSELEAVYLRNQVTN